MREASTGLDASFPGFSCGLSQILGCSSGSEIALRIIMPMLDDLDKG